MARVLILLICFANVAYAGDKDRHHPPPPRGGDVDVDVTTQVKTPVDVNTHVTTPVDVDIDSPVSVGVDAPVNIHNETNVPKQVPDAFFNYTPNYIDCGRVLGFQYGNSNGIGSFGVPLPRDKACDIWKAVNEAQENGHILLSYAFMCEIKNIRKVWGKERCNEITATAGTWWLATLKGDTDKATDAVVEFAPPDREVIIDTRQEVIEEELVKTQQQVQTLEVEIKDQNELRRKVREYERREEQKQQALDAFLDELEQREAPKDPVEGDCCDE
jgi:hypothetical protein